MTTFNWSDFLKRWREEIQESKQDQPSQESREAREGQWLGYPGATEAQLLAAEARLGITLPPSYRAFLKTSNGWRETTPFINHLYSAEELAWFSDSHPGWLNRWAERDRQKISPETNGSNSQSSVSDKDYFIYGDEQDCRQVRVEYLETALEISEVNDAAVYLLNSETMTEDGEWEAWFLADWLPGADRYPSFQALMEAEHLNSLELRGPSSVIENRDEKENHCNCDFPNSFKIEKIFSGLAIDDVSQLLVQQVVQHIAPPTLLSSSSGAILSTQPRSQQWLGIKIDKVCEWITEQVRKSVIP